MDHYILWEHGKRRKYPMRVLIYTINMYRWPRRVLLDGACPARVFSGRGIAAGSGPAMCEAKAFLPPSLM
eukprot:2513998-Pyramimonas_sp.AAC.1